MCHDSPFPPAACEEQNKIIINISLEGLITYHSRVFLSSGLNDKFLLI